MSESNSLKAKRLIVKSLKDRLRKKFNVSVAEEANNLWQRTTLAVASVSNSKSHLEETMQKIKDMIFQESGFEVLDHMVEIL